jgi:hypothetical protein
LCYKFQPEQALSDDPQLRAALVPLWLSETVASRDMGLHFIMLYTCSSWQQHTTEHWYFLFCGFAGFRILNKSIKQSHSLKADSRPETLHLNPGLI